jgi:hypothetical protein
MNFTTMASKAPLKLPLHNRITLRIILRKEPVLMPLPTLKLYNKPANLNERLRLSLTTIIYLLPLYPSDEALERNKKRILRRMLSGGSIMIRRSLIPSFGRGRRAINK